MAVHGARTRAPEVQVGAMNALHKSRAPASLAEWGGIPDPYVPCKSAIWTVPA